MIPANNRKEFSKTFSFSYHSFLCMFDHHAEYMNNIPYHGLIWVRVCFFIYFTPFIAHLFHWDSKWIIKFRKTYQPDIHWTMPQNCNYRSRKPKHKYRSKITAYYGTGSCQALIAGIYWSSCQPLRRLSRSLAQSCPEVRRNHLGGKVCCHPPVGKCGPVLPILPREDWPVGL